MYQSTNRIFVFPNPVPLGLCCIMAAILTCLTGQSKWHWGPNLAHGQKFDTYDLEQNIFSSGSFRLASRCGDQLENNPVKCIIYLRLQHVGKSRRKTSRNMKLFPTVKKGAIGSDCGFALKPVVVGEVGPLSGVLSLKHNAAKTQSGSKETSTESRGSAESCYLSASARSLSTELAEPSIFGQQSFKSSSTSQIVPRF